MREYAEEDLKAHQAQMMDAAQQAKAAYHGDPPRPIQNMRNDCPSAGQATGWVGVGASSALPPESEWRHILLVKRDRLNDRIREIDEALAALNDPAILKLQRILTVVNS